MAKSKDGVAYRKQNTDLRSGDIFYIKDKFQNGLPSQFDISKSPLFKNVKQALSSRGNGEE